MKPHLITNEAIKGIADGVALRIERSGSYVYAMGENPEKDRYTRFVQFWLAIAAEDMSRAGLFVTDLASRYEALEKRRPVRHAPDAHALSTLCNKLVDQIILEGRERATADDVLSSARKLHAALGVFISDGHSNVTVIGRADTERDLRQSGGGSS